MRLLVALLPVCMAVPWIQPAPTQFDLVPFGQMAWTPKPTGAPRHADLNDLRKRQQAPDYVCGYYSSDPRITHTCFDNQRTCMYTDFTINPTSTIGGMGCCESGVYNPAACGVSSKCLDSTAPCDAACTSDNLLLRCTDSAFPFCGTIQWLDPAFPLITSYACFATAGYYRSMLWPSGASVSSYPSSSTSTSSTPRSSPTSSPTRYTSDSLSQTTSTVPSPTDDKSGSSSPPAGLIAGGVVGGLAVIGAVILGIVYIWRKKKANTPTPPVPPPGQVDPDPQKGSYPPQPPLSPPTPMPPVYGYPPPPPPPQPHYPSVPEADSTQTYSRPQSHAPHSLQMGYVAQTSQPPPTVYEADSGIGRGA